MTGTVQRFTREFPCPVCKGADDLRRGSGERCFGFLSEDGRYIHCTREDHAGQCKHHGGSGTWSHVANGRCDCGYEHGPALAANERPKTRRPARRPKRVGFAPHHATVYRHFLRLLDLSPEHEAALAARGFPPGMAKKLGYRTLPKDGRGKILEKLAENSPSNLLHFTVQSNCGSARRAILDTPGFYESPAGDLRIAASIGASLLVPVKNREGHTVALSARPDDRGDGGPKYHWLSSAKRGGASPGAPIHFSKDCVEIPIDWSPRIRLTEGALKADLTTILSQTLTLGLPGVNRWRDALDVANDLRKTYSGGVGGTLVLAYDADWKTNGDVARPLRECAVAAWEDGWTVELEDWEIADGKGIDELLNAGKRPAVLTGDDARAMLKPPEATATGNGKHDGAIPPNAGAPRANGKPQRPDIEVSREQHETVRESVKALAAHPRVYSRGGSLVTVSIETDDEAALTPKTTLRNVAGAPKILPLSRPNVGCFLTEVATFWKWMKVHGEDQAVSCHPAAWQVDAVATLGHWSGIRELRAIAEAPFLRPDGSLCVTPGFDRATGILYHPTGSFPPVPERPNQDDARRAWEALKAPLADFPFSTDDDEAVALSAILTTIARPAIDGPVPGFAITSNKAGTGKGLLVDYFSIIAYGRVAATSGYPDDTAEANKVKVAIALSGTPVVHFDNLDGGSSYGNSALDSAITATTIGDRILGASKTATDLPLCVSWFLTGNNISPSKDAYRRWLPCNLASAEEFPEERTDISIRDLRSHAREHRGELVAAALTILRAHFAAGRPDPGWAPLGSFEAWDAIVRAAVWFATDLDPCKTRKTAAAESPDRQLAEALIAGWKELPGGTTGGHTAADAIARVTRIDAEIASTPKNEIARDHDFPTLRNALVILGRDGKLADSRRLGHKLKALKGNNVGGERFAENGHDHKVVLWVVRGTSGRESGGGLKGNGGLRKVLTRALTGDVTTSSCMGIDGECIERDQTKPPEPTKPPGSVWAQSDEDWTKHP